MCVYDICITIMIAPITQCCSNEKYVYIYIYVNEKELRNWILNEITYISWIEYRSITTRACFR